MAIFRAAVNMARRRFSTGAGGAPPSPPPPRVPFLEREVGVSVRVDTLIIAVVSSMAGAASVHIASAIYPPLIPNLARLIMWKKRDPWRDED